MTFSQWLPLFLVCLTGALSPGPSLALVVRNTVSRGTGPGALTAISHGIGVGFYAFISVLGLGSLILQSPLVFSIIQWTGVGFLLYLAWLAWRATPEGSQQSDPLSASTENKLEDSHGFYHRSIKEGLLLAVLNPKIIIFFLALFSQFLQPEAVLMDKVAMAGTALVVDATWYLLIVLALAKTPLLAFLSAKEGLVNKSSSVIMAFIATQIIWTKFS